MIEDLRQRKPIRVLVDNHDFGIFKYNFDNKRYEGIGYLTIDNIKRILTGDIKFIKIERVK